MQDNGREKVMVDGEERSRSEWLDYGFPTTALGMMAEVLTGEADIAARWVEERGEQPETD